MTSLSQALERDIKPRTIEESIARHYATILRSYLDFHAIMLAALIVEIFSLGALLNFSFKSFAVAINLALLLITLFSYLICNYYLQLKKSEQLLKLRNDYIASLQEEMESADDHLTTSKALRRLIEQLKKTDVSQKTVLPNKICQFLISKECLFMLETLYLTAIDEIHLFIKKQPLDLKAHTILSNVFIEFSRLFNSPEKKHKKEKALLMAVEELLILDDYVPNDPWIHARLASCYHLLEDVEKEMHEYELLRNLCPEDPDVLYKLGTLYFQQGHNARAMRIYEKLKSKNERLATKLISTYDFSIKTAFSTN